MTPTLCKHLAEYNRWINARLYQAASTLPEEALQQDRGAFFGSIFRTLNHIAVADLLWLRRLAALDGLQTLKADLSGWVTPASLTEPLADDFSQLAALRGRIDEVILRFAALTTDAMLAGPLRYQNMAGETHQKNLGLVVQHLFNHQTHHRGQATTLLFQAGVDPGVTDFMAIVPSQA